MHWDDPEGWDEEGGGRGVQDWDTCIHMDDSCQCMEKPLQYCKVISLRLKKKKNLPSMQETWVRSLGWEDPMEKEMATHSSILAWRIPRAEEPGGLQFMGIIKN